ncbi:helix-turn-helix domain-containing protein [Sphingopyxis sp. GC21]|uniref:helix-turn-helix domain-containing protein n=1 Tax=Sphingopyxis sp. GC21 TaxID=2933562 RepID=UPI0021E464D7|nr:helix-turn-helix domain-containing protein [Sphingopyxis sp. GC21]
MTPKQSRMARAALQWSLHDLAAAASISRMSCARFELGDNVAPETVEAIRGAFKAADADFINRAGRVGVTVPE